MNLNRQATLAADDLLWIFRGLTWDNTQSGLAALLRSRRAFVADNNITVTLTDNAAPPPTTTTVPAEVSGDFLAVWHLRGPSALKEASLQGIHKTPVLTINPQKSALGGSYLPKWLIESTGIDGNTVASSSLVPQVLPDTVALQITIDEETERAYIHWEVSADGRATPESVRNNLYATVYQGKDLADLMNERIAKDLNVSVGVINANGQRSAYDPNRPLTVKFALERIIIQAEVDQNDVTILDTSCHIDEAGVKCDATGCYLIVDGVIIKSYRL